MSTPVRIAGFVLALAVVFVIARGVGAVVPPIGTEPACDPAAHSCGGTHEPLEQH